MNSEMYRNITLSKLQFSLEIYMKGRKRKVQDEAVIWTPFKIWNETQWFSSKLSFPHDSNPAKGKGR